MPQAVNGIWVREYDPRSLRDLPVSSMFSLSKDCRTSICTLPKGTAIKVVSQEREIIGDAVILSIFKDSDEEGTPIWLQFPARGDDIKAIELAARINDQTKAV
jgi:hypothetical protein